VDVLAEGVDAQNLPRGGGRVLQLSRAFLMLEQGDHRPQGEIAQPAARRGQPLLELWRIETQPGQELAAAKRRGRGQRPRRALVRQPRQLQDVDQHRAGCQRHRLIRYAKHWRLAAAQGLAQGQQHLTQALPCARLLEVAPEQ
jgi:hypothetical protein